MRYAAVLDRCGKKCLKARAGEVAATDCIIHENVSTMVEVISLHLLDVCVGALERDAKFLGSRLRPLKLLR